MEIRTVLLALCAGLLVGVLFGITELPTPAPPRLAGVVGIFGIYAGYKIGGFLSVVL